MKKVLTVLGLIFCIAAPAHAGDVKVSGAVELQYRSGNDKHRDKGGDKFAPEELYLKVSGELDKGIEGLIKFDGADMNKGGGSHKYLEEAQIIFKDIAGSPVTVIAGKDEMPFGQDYEKFLFSSLTHEFEIDKVWGLHGIAKIDGFGSFAAAVFQRDVSDNADTGLTESYAAKVKMDKLVKNLSIEASYGKIGKDELVPAEEDQTGVSVGAKFKVAGLTLHAEQTAIKSYKNTDTADPKVTQVGADYKIKDVLLKVRHEMIDDSVDVGGKVDGKETQSAAGISYYITPKAFITLEYEATTYDDKVIVKGDEKEALLGAKVKF